MLGGRVHIWQPRDGYRAGTDPVLLAASIDARAGQTVLELGCGGAPALVCLGARVPDLDLTGVELQPAYAALARQNLVENGLNGRIFEADLTALPAEILERRFDHVIANPPYFLKPDRTAAQDRGREIALAGETPLADWVKAAAKRLVPGGYATFIQRAERLPDLLTPMAAQLGALELLPLAPRAGRPPRLILIRGRKLGRAAFRMHPPVVMHRSDAHQNHGSDYSTIIELVMKKAAALPFSPD